MPISTKEELIEYAFHKLGAPVIQIELDEQQVLYCLEDAIDMYQTVHDNGSIRKYLPYTITQQDIDNQYIPVPDSILSITKVLRTNTGMTTNLNGMGIFNPVYQMRMSDMWDLTSGSMSMYNDFMTNLNMINDILVGDISYQFNRYSNKLILDLDWQNDTLVQQGSIIVIECFAWEDESTAPRMYNDYWLKRYFISLLKKQWGSNIKKYSGTQLPGGVTLNGLELYQEAIQELNQLEEELYSRHSAPPMFLVG